MPLIKQEFLESLKAEADFLSIAGDYCQMKRSGREWAGLSPFSNEKTPSFFVNTDDNLFKCFSTGEGGDVIRFIEKKENLNFQEAVEYIADKMGRPVEYIEKDGKTIDRTSNRKKLLQLHEITADIFEIAFHENDNPAKTHWLERGLHLETAREFRVGYANIEGQELIDEIRKHGDFHDNQIKRSGLAFPDNSGKWISRFQKRLMIPIRNIQGKIVAFTARRLSDAQKSKYINSPDSPIFKKSEILFNLDRAKNSKVHKTVLVEGQIDAIAAQQAGNENFVASQGTAITPQHIKLIARFSRSIEVALDPEASGVKATERIIPIALSEEVDTTIVEIPEGEDPGSFFTKEDASEKWESLPRKHCCDFLLEMYFPSVKPQPLLKQKEEIKKMFDIISIIPLETEQEFYLNALSRHLRVKPESLTRDFLRAHNPIHNPKDRILNRIRNLEEAYLQTNNPFPGIPNEMAMLWIGQKFLTEEVQAARVAFKKEDTTKKQLIEKYLNEHGTPNKETKRFLEFNAETDEKASALLSNFNEDKKKEENPF
jgi:DNA primase